MSLAHLTVENVRCLQHAELELHPEHNLIWGANGSGKTSILEAIFVLGRGRSFRTRNSEKLIRHGQSSLIVFGRTGGSGPRSIGVQVSKASGTIAKIDRVLVSSLTELSRGVPVQVIDPGIHKLVEEGGYRRRRWLDWMVFHVEPAFAEVWVRYTRALKQRNAALRQHPDDAVAWESELVRSGELITELRRSTLERLRPAWEETVARLGGLNAELQYKAGWSHEVPLAQALADFRVRDRSRGMTHPGPHRADVSVLLDGRAARDVLSRGQQKLVAIAMVLSQLHVFREITEISPTLLLDDPAAELDGEHLQRFIAQVNRLRCQLVLTSLQPHTGLFGAPERVFHVEQGSVRLQV